MQNDDDWWNNEATISLNGPSGFLKSGRHYKRGPLHPLTGKTRETLPTMEKTMSAKPQKYLAIRETVNKTITIAIVGTPTTAITMHGGTC